MTNRSPYIVVAILCCLLAVAMSACDKGPAWVLWGASEAVCGNGRGCVEDWRVIEAYSSEKACKGEADKRRPKNADWVFTCLPDTVDPRGPKGGK